MRGWGDGGVIQALKLAWWPWAAGRCLRFSCEAAALLDDENVPCLEHSPEAMSHETIAGCTVSETIQPQPHAAAEDGLTPAPAHLVDQPLLDDSSGHHLCDAIRQHSGKSYAACSSSPPPGGSSKAYMAEWRCGEDAEPLLAGDPFIHNRCEHRPADAWDIALNKKISYNKVLPFTIISKSLNTSDSLSCTLDYRECKKSHGPHSLLQEIRRSEVWCSLPTSPRDTMVTCNDLDNDCHIVPLSFSPNLYPDVGPSPEIRCQGKAKGPQRHFESMVNSSCDNNPYVTLVSEGRSEARSGEARRGEARHSGSWPRRRPHSLRVAVCYSDPECTQQNVPERNIDLKEMSGGCMASCGVSDAASPLRITSSATSLAGPSCSAGFENSSGNNRQQLDPPETLAKASTRLDNVQKRSSDWYNNVNSSLTSKKCCGLANCQCVTNGVNLIQDFKDFNGGVTSPSSDKENDPALLSVRPKALTVAGSSPKKKKNSPKKKSRSPKKQKSEQSNNENVEPAGHKTYGSLDDDIWAVDDRLPLPTRSASQSFPRILQDSHLSPARNPKVKGVRGGERRSPRHSSHGSGLADSRCNSELSFHEVKRKSKESDAGSQDLPLTHSKLSSYSLLSEFSGPPAPCSEPLTPHTIADDTMDFYSVCSGLTSRAQSSLDGAKGEDMLDYISLASEGVSISKNVEESPMTDLEMQCLFPDENLVDDCSGFDYIPLVNECEDETTPVACVDDGEDDVNKYQDPDAISQVSGGQSPSHVSSSSSTSSSTTSPAHSPSQELVEIKYVQLSLSIVLAIVLHAMQSISQFMLEIFLATDHHEPNWD